jgi:hypothetical protein
MNFLRIAEAARVVAPKDYDDATLDDRIAKNNKWQRWTSRGGPLGPGVESTISAADLKAAVAYGDPLIQNDNGTPNIDGQVKIIADAKAGNTNATNYIWLQMQDVILDKFWHKRIGSSDKRRRRMGHNPDVWDEWLTTAWADLMSPPHQNISPEISGISALDGFHLEKSAPFAAFSNLAKRYGFLLSNSAAVMNTNDHRKGATGTPFLDDEEESETTGKKKKQEPSVVSYDPKFMDAKKEEVGDHKNDTEDAVFEEIFRSSQDAEGFFEAIEDIVNDVASQTKGPAGTKMLEPFLYFVGEPMGKDESGLEVHAKTLGQLFKKFPEKDGSALYKYVKYTFPKMLKEWGINMEEFLKYANDDVTNARIRKIIKKAL